MPFTWEIKTGPALSDWDASLARILARGGEAFRSEIAHYPPPRGGPWSHRTGNLAATVQFNVKGHTMELGGPKTLAYLLDGTGVFGPTGQPIRAKNGGVLAIPITGAGNIASAGVKTSSMGLSYGKAGGHLKSRDTGVMFRRSVKGSVWAGKLEAAKARTIRGVELGFKEVFE